MEYEEKRWDEYQQGCVERRSGRQRDRALWHRQIRCTRESQVDSCGTRMIVQMSVLNTLSAIRDNREFLITYR